VTALLTPFLTAWWAGHFGINSKRYQLRTAATAAHEPIHGAV